MGLPFVRRALRGNSADEIIEARFELYYPRLFAYLLSNVGSPGRSRDLLTELFANILSTASALSEEEFRVMLFAAARDACRKQARRVPLDFGLSEVERDTVTLVFDAGLTEAEAQSICGAERFGSDFQRALVKLRNAAAAVEIPPFYRAT